MEGRGPRRPLKQRIAVLCFSMPVGRAALLLSAIGTPHVWSRQLKSLRAAQ